jgi:hypothetical protein
LPAFAWTRLSIPLPTSIASVDQTALDGTELILGAVGVKPSSKSGGHLIVWGIGGRRDGKGTLTADPDSSVTLAMSGVYEGDNFLVSGPVSLRVGTRSIPFERLDIRGQLGPDLTARPGATLFGFTDAASIPAVGQYLGVNAASAISAQAVMSGTFLTAPYPRSGSANKQPRGLQVSFVEYVQPTTRLPGQIVAHFRLARGASYKLSEHRIAIILIDRVTDQVVPLDYTSKITVSATPQGDVSQAVLTIPEDSELSQELAAVVIADVFPLHREKLEYRPQAK